MATWLNEYNNLKDEIKKQLGNGTASLEQLMQYQELLYRIEVLSASQAFCQTAPITTEVSVLSSHYQLVDAYIQCLTKERAWGARQTKRSRPSVRRHRRLLIRSFWTAESAFPALLQRIKINIVNA